MKALVGLLLVLGGVFGSSAPSRAACTQEALSAVREDFWKIAPRDGSTSVVRVAVSADGDHAVASLQADRGGPILFSCEYRYACDESGLHLKRGECRNGTILPVR